MDATATLDGMAEPGRAVVPAVFHLRRARDLMDRHFAEPLDLGTIAAAAGRVPWIMISGIRDPDRLWQGAGSSRRTGCTRSGRQRRQGRSGLGEHDHDPRDTAYSRHHFVRTFRAAYGETPGRYLTRRRIERAADLLRSANLTVTDVCHAVGFASLGTFSRTFSELMGESPTAYRHRHEESGVPRIPGCFAMAWGRPRGGASTATTDKQRAAGAS